MGCGSSKNQEEKGIEGEDNIPNEEKEALNPGDSSSVPINSKKGKVLQINKNYAKIFGYSNKKELMQNKSLNLMGESSLKKVLKSNFYDNDSAKIHIENFAGKDASLPFKERPIFKEELKIEKIVPESNNPLPTEQSKLPSNLEIYAKDGRGIPIAKDFENDFIPYFYDKKKGNSDNANNPNDPSSKVFISRSAKMGIIDSGELYKNNANEVTKEGNKNPGSMPKISLFKKEEKVVSPSLDEDVIKMDESIEKAYLAKKNPKEKKDSSSDLLDEKERLLKKLQENADQFALSPSNEDDIPKLLENTNRIKEITDFVRSEEMGSFPLSELNYNFRKICKNEFELVFCIYIWITHNIAYDTEAFFSGEISDTSLENIIQKRKTISAGYTNLFNSMAFENNITSVILSGYGKGYGYNSELKVPSRPLQNHDWISVKIGNNWYLIDPTWGAGYIDDEKHFQKRFSMHYFVTDPSLFIIDHFPLESKWQLIEHPKEWSDFFSAFKLESGFFEQGFYDLNIKNSKLSVEDSLTLFLKNKNETRMQIRMISDNKAFSPQDTIRYSLKKQNFNNISISINFPVKGKYYIRVYGLKIEDVQNLNNEENNIPLLFECIVEAELKKGPFPKYPTFFASYRENKAELISPLFCNLKIGDKVKFEIKINNIDEIFVICDKDVTCLKRNADIIEGEASITSEKPALAIKSGKNQFKFLVMYD